jgi:hypothetical protein
LGLDGDVPDPSTFSKNRHGRFRASDLLRKLFETVVARCIKEGTPVLPEATSVGVLSARRESSFVAKWAYRTRAASALLP